MRWWNPMHMVVGPDGNLSQARVFSVSGKIAIIVVLRHHIESLVANPEALLIMLGFLILPNVIDKIVSAKYGVKDERPFNNADRK